MADQIIHNGACRFDRSCVLDPRDAR